MSTIKSSNEHLTLNADGSSKDIKFQANGVEKASISSSGAFTSTTIDATKLTGDLPAISGASLTALNASNLGSGTVPTARLGSGTASSSTFLRGDSTYAEAGGGKVLQVVSSTGGTSNLSATTTESDIGLNLDITPQAGSYLLLIVTVKYHLVNNQGAYWRGYWFKDSTNIGQAFYVNQDQDGGNTDETAVSQKYYTDAAFNGSTSFEFSLRISQTNGYTRHGHSGQPVITAIEIGA